MGGKKGHCSLRWDAVGQRRRDNKDGKSHRGNLGNGRTWTFLFPSQTDSQVEVTSQRPPDSETLPAQASPRHSTCRDNLVSTVSSIAASTTHQSKRPYLTSN